MGRWPRPPTKDNSQVKQALNPTVLKREWRFPSSFPAKQGGVHVLRPRAPRLRDCQNGRHKPSLCTDCVRTGYLELG